MKDFFKIVILLTIIMVMTGVAIWGAVTFNSNTEIGWKLWGGILFYGIVIFPAVNFWREQLMEVLDLED